MRVVLAEDSLLLREGLVRLLGEAGAEVVEAVGDGEALVRAVVAHRPDVAMVDVRMPPSHTEAHLLDPDQVGSAPVRDEHRRVMAVLAWLRGRPA